MNARWVSWVGLLTFVLHGCGKSRADRAPSMATGASGGESGAVSAGAPGAGRGGSGGGSGANAGGKGGSNSVGGDAGSGIVIAGGTSAGGASDGGAHTGGATGGASVVCEGHVGFVTVSGALPTEFGSNMTLGAGCSNIGVDDHPFPVNYSQRKPDSGGIDHNVFACGADGSSLVQLRLSYPSATGEPSGAVIFSFNGAVLHSPAFTSFVETQRPLEHWPYPSDEAEGLGKVFAGSFEAPGPANSGTITGTFSVCHVGNLPAPGT